MAFFIGCLLVLTANQTLISPTTGLLSGCAMLYYFLDTQLFLQSQFAVHREHNVSQGRNQYEGLTGRSTPLPQSEI